MSAFKDRLTTALHDSVQYFNDSQDPNAAVQKAAELHDFNAEQTARLIETFNTARTLYHFKTADDRTASFALADRDVVLPRLFEVRPAEKVAEALPDYGWYDQVVPDYHTDTVKQADTVVELDNGTPSIDELNRQAIRYIAEMRDMSKTAADEARGAATNSAWALQKLASQLCSGYVDQAVDRYARLVCCAASEPALAPLATKLAEFMAPGYRDTDAQLRTVKQASVVDDSDLGPSFELLKEASQWLDIETEMLAISNQLEKEANDFEREYAEALGHTFQVDDSPAALIRTTKVAGEGGGGGGTKIEKKFQGIDLLGEPYTGTTVSGSGAKKTDQTGIVQGIADSAIAGAQKPIGDFLNVGIDRAFTAPRERENKALSERLKNVQRGIMLQDLMTNDPVLSEEEPATVANAYNALLQLAPDVAANREIVRSILRQTVTSVAVSPYDADLWTKLEQNLRGLQGKGQPPRKDQQK